MANVVNGVINTLGLQPSQTSIQSGSTSTAVVTKSRQVTRYVCIPIPMSLICIKVDSQFIDR